MDRVTWRNGPDWADSEVAAHVRTELRMRHYSPRTQEAYLGWILRYLRFHGSRHPSEMGKTELEAFLSALATERNVSASTQNQALGGLLFLYREVLTTPIGWLDEGVRAERPKRNPGGLPPARGPPALRNHPPPPPSAAPPEGAGRRRTGGRRRAASGRAGAGRSSGPRPV